MHSYEKKIKKDGVRIYVENLIHKTISKNVCDVYTRMKNNGDTIFRDAAWELALERLNTREVWL